MKTITLTDEQFDNLFNYLDDKVNYIVDKSIDYQDSEILNEWEDLIEVYDIIEDIMPLFCRRRMNKHSQQILLTYHSVELMIDLSS